MSMTINILGKDHTWYILNQSEYPGFAKTKASNLFVVRSDETPEIIIVNRDIMDVYNDRFIHLEKSMRECIHNSIRLHFFRANLALNENDRYDDNIIREMTEDEITRNANLITSFLMGESDSKEYEITPTDTGFTVIKR